MKQEKFALMIADLDLSPEEQENILSIAKDLTGEERDIMFQSLKDIDAEEESTETEPIN